MRPQPLSCGNPIFRRGMYSSWTRFNEGRNLSVAETSRTGRTRRRPSSFNEAATSQLRKLASSRRAYTSSASFNEAATSQLRKPDWISAYVQLKERLQ